MGLIRRKVLMIDGVWYCSAPGYKLPFECFSFQPDSATTEILTVPPTACCCKEGFIPGNYPVDVFIYEGKEYKTLRVPDPENEGQYLSLSQACELAMTPYEEGLLNNSSGGGTSYSIGDLVYNFSELLTTTPDVDGFYYFPQLENNVQTVIDEFGGSPENLQVVMSNVPVSPVFVEYSPNGLVKILDPDTGLPILDIPAGTRFDFIYKITHPADSSIVIPKFLNSLSIVSGVAHWNYLNGMNAGLTLNQNATLSFENLIVGEFGTAKIILPDAPDPGGYTLGFATTMGVPIYVSTTAIDNTPGANNVVTFWFTGVEIYVNISNYA